jgi:hypothetical protein
VPTNPQPSDRQLDALAEMLLTIAERKLDQIDREERAKHRQKRVVSTPVNSERWATTRRSL